MATENELRRKSVQYRKKLLTCIRRAGGGHTSGDLSCVDILNVLYNEILNVSPETFDSPDRDRYIQSKGHSVEGLYVVLAERGFFAEEQLETLAQYKSHFVGHPTRKVPGIEQNTGSLGHGLSLGVGEYQAMTDLSELDLESSQFVPEMDRELSERNYRGWGEALKRVL